MKRDHRLEVSSCINTEEKVAMSRDRRLSGTKHSKPARKELEKGNLPDSQPVSREQHLCEPLKNGKQCAIFHSNYKE